MITSPFEAMTDLFEAVAADGFGADATRLNVCPTETVPVVVSTPDGRALVPMRWGFLPSWYKTPNDGPLLINARAETVAAKPAFRQAIRQRRGLVPANGFYEWKGAKGAKTPFRITPRSGGLIAFAGLWQDWGPPDARTGTVAIVTCDASETLSAVHERMPVVLAPEDWPLWLGEAGTGAAALMRPAPEELLLLEEGVGPDARAFAR